ncbi:coiled-coil domain-containing protein 90B, mitochondrial-like [Corticium candelabrum]|uniref:coiled-coil domain-containing protein 90B, mitochondrial-like n=1 Tax=Corticium candelabrum TaxID=121492 RepID=UPI002E2549DE|nr:coiled-coil domain-containing protein 90B, mitochondrial-like [Corticium candelabrum]
MRRFVIWHANKRRLRKAHKRGCRLLVKTRPFDTHEMIKDLQNAGYSITQAEALTLLLSNTVSSVTQETTSRSVTKLEQEVYSTQWNARLDSIRKDMAILEKTEFSSLKEENEKLKVEVVQLRNYVKDELSKMRSSLTLDLNLEKSRSREEISHLEQQIRDTNNRIEVEAASVQTNLEKNKVDVIKYLAGTILSVATFMLAYWRLTKS